MADEKKTTPQNTKPTILPEVTEYENGIKAKLNQRYQQMIKRLETETNIINRYELKISLESLLETYKTLFPNG